MFKHFKSYSLKNHNTFGINSIADDFYEYSTIEDLENILKNEINKDKKILNIGSGSNLLFQSDFKGSVLHSKISGIKIENDFDYEVVVSAGAGVIWDDLVKWCIDHNLGGIENLSLIPGTVGAAAIQNIGAYGSELKDVFYKVEGLFIKDCGDFVYFLNDCKFDYRYSIFKDALKDKIVITRLFLRLSKNPVFNLEYGTIKNELEKQKIPATLQNIRNTIISIRNSKLPDPAITGNAGSFFKNPFIHGKQFFEIKKNYPDLPYFDMKPQQFKVPAGWLIEKAGWKGKQMGRAGVHPNQALVLVNLDGATGNEIIELANAIEKDVMKKFGVILEKEVCVI